MEIEGRRVDAALPGRQGVLLFAFLVVNRHRPSSRGDLVEALWREGARPSAADSALSALLSKLRSAVGQDSIVGRTELRLALPREAFVDLETAHEAIHTAESAIARKEWEGAWAPGRIALHTANRGFLPEHDLPWVDEVRRDLEDLQLRALECVAAAGLGIGGPEVDATVRSGRRLIALAPHRESGYRYLMGALERRDNVAEALDVYEQLRGRLRDDLGVVPGDATQALHRRLIERRSG